jgi:hypothetical protein
MKRILLISAIALLAVAFVSCKKDGVYNPKHKVAKVYNEWVRTTVTTDANGSTTRIDSLKPYVAQEWAWGDKTLTNIVNKNTDGEIISTVTYTYDDKNRITGCKGSDNETAEYIYNDDKKLQTIKITEGPNKTTTIDIAYDGKVPTSITTVWKYTIDKKVSNFTKNILPEYICSAMESNQIHAKATTFSNTLTSAIEWDGKNISQVVTTGEDNYKHTVTYEYDSKSNPFIGMYAEMDYEIAYSKNNIVKRTESYVEGNKTIIEEESFEYEYDGKMPVKCIYTDVHEDEYFGTTYKITTVNTTTYEYTK